MVGAMQFHFQNGNLMSWNFSQSILITPICPVAISVLQLGGEYSLTQEGEECNARLGLIMYAYVIC